MAKTQASTKLATLRRTWLLLLVAFLLLAALVRGWRQNSQLNGFQARPMSHVSKLIHPNVRPRDLITPTDVKTAYNLADGGGSGTIAIIDAYDDPTIENDLAVFDNQYGLASCPSPSCFEKHKMTSRVSTSGSWAIEAALDVEWAHAIAPGAKILLVEARSASGNDLLSAINYARGRSDVVAVSMSWGGGEFSSEGQYESSFTSPNGATFFAASGDNGHGTSWPAVSANVIGIGGTTLNVSGGVVTGETAWSGSGGGVSRYITEPAFQTTAGITNTGGKRAMPDVAYDADPNTGFPVYDSTSYFGYRGWFQVGGTSAGTPQWAAIRSITGPGLTAAKVYQDSSSAGFLHDITTGSNGSCGAQCTAASGFDLVTGLGSPLTKSF